MGHEPNYITPSNRVAKLRVMFSRVSVVPGYGHFCVEPTFLSERGFICFLFRAYDEGLHLVRPHKIMRFEDPSSRPKERLFQHTTGA